MPTTYASAKRPLCIPDLCLADLLQCHVAKSTEFWLGVRCPLRFALRHMEAKPCETTRS